MPLETVDVDAGSVLYVLGIILSGLCGWWGIRAKARSDREVKLTEPAAAQWQPLVKEMKTFFQTQIDGLRREVEGLRTEIEQREAYEVYSTARIYEQRAVIRRKQLHVPTLMTFPEWKRERDLREKSDSG